MMQPPPRLTLSSAAGPAAMTSCVATACCRPRLLQRLVRLGNLECPKPSKSSVLPLKQFQDSRDGIGQERLDISRPRPKQAHYVPGGPIPDPQPDDLRWRTQHSGQLDEVRVL